MQLSTNNAVDRANGDAVCRCDVFINININYISRQTGKRHHKIGKKKVKVKRNILRTADAADAVFRRTVTFETQTKNTPNASVDKSASVKSA